MKKKNINGYITVYLSLLTGLLLSLIFLVIEGTRIQTNRFTTECVMDMALNSSFAEYNRQLLEQYELFFIDASYGSETLSYDNVETHIRSYMNLNFQETEGVVDTIFQVSDILGLQADNVTIELASLASDDNGEVLAYQIVEYKKAQTGIAVVESVIENSTQVEAWASSNPESERIATEATINELLLEKKIELELEDEITLNNPADTVNSIRGSGVIGLAYPEGKMISGQGVTLSEYMSGRTLNVGNGLQDGKEYENSIVNEKLIIEYLFQTCSYFGAEQDKSKLKYQVEYLLEGNESDEENLKGVLNEILAIREAANIAYLYSDAAKQAEAEALALSITASLAMPQLEQAVKLSILFAWSYAESVQDIRILMDGKAVPVVKTSATWNTPLSQMASFSSYLGQYNATDQGMTYKDYLESLLWIHSDSDRMMLFMDIIEMDIRQTSGNTNFCMDGCFDWMQATANVSTTTGEGYRITRQYGYE